MKNLETAWRDDLDELFGEEPAMVELHSPALMTIEIVDIDLVSDSQQDNPLTARVKKTQK